MSVLKPEYYRKRKTGSLSWSLFPRHLKKTFVTAHPGQRTSQYGPFASACPSLGTQQQAAIQTNIKGQTMHAQHHVANETNTKGRIKVTQHYAGNKIVTKDRTMDIQHHAGNKTGIKGRTMDPRLHVGNMVKIDNTRVIDQSVEPQTTISKSTIDGTLNKGGTTTTVTATTNTDKTHMKSAQGGTTMSKNSLSSTGTTTTDTEGVYTPFNVLTFNCHGFKSSYGMIVDELKCVECMV